MLLALVGCAADCPPLAEVVVVDGTEAQRDVVSGELAALGATLAVPVCVARVHVTPFAASDHAGTYSRWSHGVRLDAALDGEDLRGVLRHEVCHAVGFQNDLVDGDRGDDEAFAETCELGAWGLDAVLATDCPDDLLDRDAVARVYAGVYGGVAAPPARTYRSIAAIDAAQAGAPRGTPLGYVGVTEAEGDLLLLQGGNLGAFVWVDAFTGAPADHLGAPRYPPDPVPPALPYGWRETRWGPLGGPLDDAASAVTAEAVFPTGGAVRTIARVDGAWTGVPGAPCVADAPRYFPFGDDLWWADVTDDTLTWGHLSPP